MAVGIFDFVATVAAKIQLVRAGEFLRNQSANPALAPGAAADSGGGMRAMGR